MSEQHFETILSALADKIKEQADTIMLQKYQIENLERKLADANGNACTEKMLEIR